MYHAWWFILVLSFFTLNLVACSLNRLPRIISLTVPSDGILDAKNLQNLSHVKKFNMQTITQETEKKIESILARSIRKPHSKHKDGNYFFFAEKGRLSYGSFYLTHLGLIIIITGVIIGTFGYQGYMKLDEGETSRVVTDKKSLALKNLEFEVRCDKFEVTFYDKAQMPKDYKSTLTVLEEGKEVLTKVIEVNDPLIYKGIYMYQSSYGIASGGKGEVTLQITPRGAAQAVEYRVKTRQRFSIAGTQDEAQIERIVPDFGINEQGKVFSRSDEPRNPAVQLTIYPQNNASYQTWVFANFPDFHKKPDQQYDIRIDNFQPQYYTGLQVTRDPGVWIVWVGCATLICGIYCAFFMAHRRVWLSIEKNDKYYKAVLAGTANKNKTAFAGDFTRLYETLKRMEKQ